MPDPCKICNGSGWVLTGGAEVLLPDGRWVRGCEDCGGHGFTRGSGLESTPAYEPPKWVPPPTYNELARILKWVSDAFWSDGGLNNTNLLDGLIAARRIVNPDIAYDDNGRPLTPDTGSGNIPGGETCSETSDR